MFGGDGSRTVQFCPSNPCPSVAVNGESVMFDMDRVGLFQDGEGGHREAVSVRNAVFLAMEISGILLVSAVVLVLFYRRNIDEVEKEEMTPLLNKKDIEF